MPQIRPISDLRNNFTDISKIIHKTEEPIFLTKNGYGDMVVMSLETYDKLLIENEIYSKLKESEIQATSTKTRYSHKDVFDDLKSQFTKNGGANDV